MELTIDQVLFELAQNKQVPTLPIGTVVYYDDIRTPKTTQVKSLEQFKNVLSVWYNFKQTFGEEDQSLNYFEITGIKIPTV
ncbi:hypothetical protein [Mucilaginibacter sp. UR6-11]|uniref:hypothetical protein n=1 Tax=Mucilaginibacter sp. UR6-11 TaxID=1435644 RepID=UPI001E54E906|nr:hypothetical protein [Mucilaginibacter sp. UR6-11]MCC8426942.1 hypothetical protein [Mucilaginibacter sp. UR6-11]